MVGVSIVTVVAAEYLAEHYAGRGNPFYPGSSWGASTGENLG
jgi:hypothetical protein